MTEERQKIQEFLKTQSLTLPDAPEVLKAGVVPFLVGEPRYLMMTPIASRPHLPPPQFQLCKGTRMHLVGGEWVDMRAPAAETQRETLAETALREGIEELGIRIDGIELLHDMGMFDFSSANSGKAKSMWLFAAKMKSEDCLLPSSAIAFTTAARAWMTLAEFAVAGRDDHYYILQQMDAILRQRSLV